MIKSDIFSKSGMEIVALPRRVTGKTPLPREGIYIGSGVYTASGSLLNSGLAFTTWSPNYPRISEIVRLCKEANQGNTLQFWQKGELFIELCKEAVEAGLYATCIYSDAPDELAARLASFGDSYLGYDFGERYTFRLEETNVTFDRGKSDEEIKKYTLRTIADSLMRLVKAHVDERHAAGWGNIMTTAASFSIDYEIAAGAEIPCCEDFAFKHMLFASSLARGLYRQYDLPLWGSHVAHEWYSWIPHTNRRKMKLLETCFYMKYMTGAKLIINESGNWYLQSSLCPDSPMHTMQRVPGDPPGLWHASDSRSGLSEEMTEAAKRNFANIDYRSPVAVKYRKIISDFYDFCKANKTPAGQPEASIALAKGNFDLSSSSSPAHAVGSAFNLARLNSNWLCGAPEQSWNIVRDVFYPCPPVLEPDKNQFLSGTPYGMVDIVSFAYDNISADFLSRNYKALIFSGWNTCSVKQYDMLVRYVKAGGRLVISLPHLSCDEARNYNFFTVKDLVNEGDFSDLCGLRILGEGARFYWATGNSVEPNCLGLACPRRYGIMGVPLAEVELVGEMADHEFLAVDDERMRPVIIRCKRGKGEVFFVNTWGYPALVNNDIGPGAVNDSDGLMGLLYSYVAKISRGHTWITGPDFREPDRDCKYIAHSYFPDAGKICLLNIDYENSRKCVLHNFGDKDFIELAPGEFRMIDSVVLEQFEKQNSE